MMEMVPGEAPTVTAPNVDDAASAPTPYTRLHSREIAGDIAPREHHAVASWLQLLRVERAGIAFTSCLLTAAAIVVVPADSS